MTHCNVFLCSEHTLQLATVSPVLAGMKDMEVPMPMMSSHEVSVSIGRDDRTLGAPQITSCALTVAGFGSEVELLRTRTRPKKMRFLASNGMHCTFLLKVLPSNSWTSNQLPVCICLTCESASCLRIQANEFLLIAASGR